MKKSIACTMLRAVLAVIIALTSCIGMMSQPMQAAAPTATCATPALYSATGTDAASLQTEVDAFRDAIGALNAPHPINHVDGRRQIDWDAAPDGVSAPNTFPGDFFNASVFPRARGIQFTTPGTELQLSATAASGAGIEFSNIDTTYSDEFAVFSAERLFTPIGDNVVDVRFFSPADQTTPALVDSFGVIFTDVDLADVTKLEFYGVDDNLVYTQVAAAIPGSETLSLAGVKFAQPCVARVRITAGNVALQAGIQDGDGRRQIDWDAAPDSISAPNAFPGDFFNGSVFPRARGIAFGSEGTGFQLSATADSGAGIEFENINANYASIFRTFSPERLFTPLGSNVVTADFFNPAEQATPARVNGFGAVFSDVDLDAKTTIAYYDVAGKLLYKQGVQPQAGSEGLSFAGVKFDTSCVSFVKLTSGTSALGADVNDDPDNGVDLVVMDDFIYGEPQPTEPVPGNVNRVYLPVIAK